MQLKPYITTPDNAGKIADWLRTRGGIAIWQAIDFNRLGQTLTTPLNTADGQPHAKPTHWVDSTPACVITDFADVLISKDVEVSRLKVALRLGSNGLQVKCTDASTRRIRTAIAKAGTGAYHEFDYETQEAVIFKPQSQMPLLDYLAMGETKGIHLVKTA
jgi:hypothetical protein